MTRLDPLLDFKQKQCFHTAQTVGRTATSCGGNHQVREKALGAFAEKCCNSCDKGLSAQEVAASWVLGGLCMLWTLVHLSQTASSRLQPRRQGWGCLI